MKENLFTNKENSTILITQDGEVWGIFFKFGLSRQKAKKEFGKVCSQYGYRIKDFTRMERETLWQPEDETTWYNLPSDADCPFVDCWGVYPTVELMNCYQSR